MESSRQIAEMYTMSRKALVVWLLVECAVACIVAYAAHRWFQHSMAQDALFGVGLFLALLIAHMHVSIHELGERSEKLRGVLDGLRAEDRFSELLLIKSP